MIGPAYFAVKVATRPDNVTVYLGSRMGQRGYVRESLDKAARFTTRESAELHLEASNEIGPEVVELRSVIRQAGDWRGWHATDGAKGLVLHGPNGETVLEEASSPNARAARFGWIAQWPEAGPLLNHHNHVRRFGSAIAARKAIERALLDAHRAMVSAAVQRSQTLDK